MTAMLRLLMTASCEKKSLREKISARILRVDVCGIFLAPHVGRKRATHFSQFDVLAAEPPRTTTETG
jgi:hypothetical protein